VSAVAIALLLATAVGLQMAREHLPPRRMPSGVSGNLMYVRSPEVMSRAALSYRMLLADAYWIRALQHFGRARQAAPSRQHYDLLYPLLDLTTSLDPRFNVAYRFGSIFLTEPPPGGPGRPDLAIALLKKGLASQPHRWEYAQDIGFVHYRERDYASAADWFGRAAAIPGAPSWLQPLEAVTRTRGGDRGTARLLWSQLGASTEDKWLRNESARRLRQLDALDAIDRLAAVIGAYKQRTGNLPRTWMDLIRARYIGGIPLDPDGRPMQLNPYSGAVTLEPGSPLSPLPTDEDPIP
jgi:tetratricopeptide (TPR) repeat protein